MTIAGRLKYDAGRDELAGRRVVVERRVRQARAAAGCPNIARTFWK